MQHQFSEGLYLSYEARQLSIYNIHSSLRIWTTLRQLFTIIQRKIVTQHVG